MKNWRRKAALLLATSMVFSGNWQSSVPAQEMPETTEEFLTEDAAVSADNESAEEFFTADVVSDGFDETNVLADAADMQETLQGETAGLIDIDDGDLSAEETDDTVPGAAAVEMVDAADLIEDPDDLIPADDLMPDAETSSEWAEPETEDEFVEVSGVMDSFGEFEETSGEDLPGIGNELQEEEEISENAEETVLENTGENADAEEAPTERTSEKDPLVEDAEEEEAQEQTSELAAVFELDLDPFISVTENGVMLSDKKIGVEDPTKDLILHFDLAGAKAKFPELAGLTPEKDTDSRYLWLNYKLSTPDTIDSFSYINLEGDRTIKSEKWTDYLDHYSSCVSLYIGTDYYRSDKYTFVTTSLSGKCGPNAYWRFVPSTKCLEITGTGAMYSFSGTNSPWYAMKDSIKTVTVADGITNLGHNSFRSCTNLEKITIPETVTLIGNSCFISCSALSEVEGGAGVRTIDLGAFNSCSALKTLSFPSIEKIGYWAFRSCKSLEHLYLLSKDLKEISVNETGDPLYQGPFQWDDSTLTVHMYAGTRGSEYYREENWKIQSENPPKVSIEIETATVTGITDQIYNGTPITLKPEVSDNAYVLKEGTDYIITYTENTAAGTASMTIEGAGDYTGKITGLSFKINPLDLSTVTVEGPENQIYNGTDLTPALTVKTGDVILTADKDYTVVYKDNKNTGTATVRVTGTGSCTGAISKTFKINPLDLSTATVDDLEDQIYNGTALTPAPTVKTGDVILAADKDYTVTYQNNTDPGTATVTITGKDNCTGTVTKTFRIKEREKVPSPLPEDAASIENPLVVKDVETTIAEMKTDEDIKGSSFNLLQLKAVARTSSIKLSWKKVAGAKEYVIYGNKCGKKNRYKKITTVTGKQLILKKVNGKKLKKGTYYKFLVMAVSDQDVLAVSKTIHVAHKGGKYGNAVKVTLDKTKINLKKKKKATITPYVKVGSLTVKNHRAVVFESSDIRIATVTKKGKIKAKEKGTCYVYAYAQNGKFAKVKVVVK